MRKSQRGFALEYLLFAAVIIIVAVVAATLAVTNRHKSTNSSANTSTSQTANNSSGQTTNPYAGWKTYCDNTYNYCLKYPTNWQFTSTAATKVGDTGGINLLSPSKNVEVIYSNAFTKDSNPVSFNTVSVDSLSSANQNLSVVGGYIATFGVAGNYYSSYSVVDSSLLNTYPLTVGSASQFPGNTSFTNKSSGSYNGSLIARDAVTINTTQQAKDWFSSDDAKTGLLILQSFYYKQ